MKTPLFWLPCLLLAALSNAFAASTYTAVPIGTNGSPRGYWEFLPDAYHNQPAQDFALLIHLHGLGGGGNGDSELSKIKGNGPMKLINSSSHALHTLFDDRDIVVIAPQAPTPSTWWNQTHIRPFLDHVLANYRIDPSRIYLTGSSAGSTGIQDFMNKDDQADQITALVPVAVRNSISQFAELEGGTDGFAWRGVVACEGVPLWGMMAIGDGSSVLMNTVNRLAGYRESGLSANPAWTGPGDPETHVVTTLTNVMANDPEKGVPTNDRQHVTALYLPGTGWTWQYGVSTDDGYPKMTLNSGSSHSNRPFYDDVKLYDWLFDQVKPTASITLPAVPTLITEGSSINLAANATDENGTPITGTDLQWSSNIDGILGHGESLTVNNLSQGAHIISCRAMDSRYRAKRVTQSVTVANVDAFTARIDFGHTTNPTTEAGWNNLTDYTAGVLPNAMDENDQPTGMRVEVTSRFHGLSENGVLAADLYPQTAQQDSWYCSTTYPRAEFLISGLNPAQTYDFTLFGSRTTTSTNPLNAVYEAGGQSVQLATANNTNQTASLSGVSPDAAGTIVLAVERVSTDPAWVGAYLNALVITTAGSGGGGDSDSDGLADSWEILHFNGLSESGTGDYDGDGLPNLLEYGVGSDPVSRADKPAIEAAHTEIGQDRYVNLTYHRDSAASGGLTYAIEASSDLQNWSPLSVVQVSVVPVTGKTGVDAVTVRSPNSLLSAQRQFLRLVVSTNP